MAVSSVRGMKQVPPPVYLEAIGRPFDPRAAASEIERFSLLKGKLSRRSVRSYWYLDDRLSEPLLADSLSPDHALLLFVSPASVALLVVDGLAFSDFFLLFS